MKKPPSKWFFASATAIVFFVIALVCVGYFTYTILPFSRNKVDIKIEGDRALVNDNSIGFVAAPNASSIRKHFKTGLAYHLFNDERGGRVNSPRTITGDRVAIMTIGCSFSIGHGIENEETFTSILGQRFGVPVANYSQSSYGTLQSLQMLERNLDQTPKIIIYGFIEDHPRRNLAPGIPPAYAPFYIAVSHIAFDSGGKPYVHAPDMRFSVEKAQQFLEDVVFDNSFGINDILWGARIAWLRYAQKDLFSYVDTSETRQKSMDFLMRKMSEAARSIDAALIVLYIPLLTRGETSPPSPVLIKSLSSDVVFVDLSPVIKNYYSNPENPDLRLKNDGHPNRLAHRLIADELEKIIRSKDLVATVKNT